MKIHTLINSSKGNYGSLSTVMKSGYRNHVLPLASGGEDMIELSAQAINLNKRSQIYNLTEERTRRAVRDVMPDVLNVLAELNEQNDASSHQAELVSLISQIDDNSKAEIFSDTADILIGFLL